MKKKYGIYYNQQFDVLMAALQPATPITTVETIDQITFLKNGDRLIGFNMFLPPDAPRPETSFCSENPHIVAYLESRLAPWIDLHQEPQFIIGKILETAPIPNTHLQVCQVNLGQEKIATIVCGAANARPGLIGVVAVGGAWMPDSQVITPKTLMGYETEGMLCSAKELQIKPGQFNDHGIIELSSSYQDQIGHSFWREYYAKETKLSI